MRPLVVSIAFLLLLSGCQGAASPSGSPSSSAASPPRSAPVTTAPATRTTPPTPPPVVPAAPAGAAASVLALAPVPRSTTGKAAYTVDPKSPVSATNFASLSALLAAVTLKPGEIVDVSPDSVYTDQVVFTGSHSGAPGNPVVIRATPTATNKLATWDGSLLTPTVADAVERRGFFWQFDLTSHDIDVCGIEVANTPHFPQVSSSGATFATNNRGIFFLGANLTFHHGSVHHNGNGFMAPYQTKNIRVESCEVAFNGSGDGYTHNFYMQGAGTHIRFNSIHDANGGINYKDRSVPDATGLAVEFAYNRVENATNGGYELDFQGNDAFNAGLTVTSAYVIGNVIVKGATGNTSVIVNVGGATVPTSRNGTVHLVNNTIFAAATTTAFLNIGAVSTVELTNNVYYGKTSLLNPGALGALTGTSNLLMSGVAPLTLAKTTVFTGAVPSPSAAPPPAASGIGVTPSLPELAPVFEMPVVGTVVARTDGGSVAGARSR